MLWAVWAVDSLYYLEELIGIPLNGLGGHNPDVQDIALIRWATGTAISALDLCAAVLARENNLKKGKNEFDMGNIGKVKNQLPTSIQNWVSSVEADSRYQDILDLRHSLTHARVSRHLSLGGPTKINLKSGIDRSVVEIVTIAKELATEHVEKMLLILPTL